MTTWPLQVLFYGAGESIDGAGALAGPIADQLARVAGVATNQAVAAIAQLDATAWPTYRWILDPRGRFAPEAVAEVNTGDPSELVAFVDWAVARCPADRTILVLSGHGLAWRDDQAARVVGATRTGGFAAPGGSLRHAHRLLGAPSRRAALSRAVLLDGGQRDFLSNLELAAACERVAARLGRPIDVLVFDACLMSSWELLVELERSVRTVVGTIDELSAAGLELAEPVRSASIAGGMLDSSDLATRFVTEFTPRAPFDTCVAVELTRPAWPIARDRLQAAVTALRPFLAASVANRERLRAALSRATTSLVRFTGGGLADVGALATSFVDADLPGLAVTAMAEVRDAIAASVLATSLGDSYQGAIGLSLFTPSTEATYAANRNEYRRLELPRATGWVALLDLLFGFTPS